MSDLPFPILIAAFIAVAAILVFVGVYLEKQKRQALQAVADRLGLVYQHGRDRSLSSRFNFLNQLSQGSNRYASHCLSGRHFDENVLVFEHHHETHSTDSKGHRTTHHHYFAVVTVALPRLCPELTIASETFLSKIAQAFGYDDIDFESAEFSKAFCVRSKDKRFAYDVCHPRMMEFLLANRDLNVEIENAALAIVKSGRLDPRSVSHNLNRLVEFKKLMPDYVLEARA
jgi:hypothetical protein